MQVRPWLVGVHHALGSEKKSRLAYRRAHDDTLKNYVGAHMHTFRTDSRTDAGGAGAVADGPSPVRMGDVKERLGVVHSLVWARWFAWSRN